jgi:hypothetical protein
MSGRFVVLAALLLTGAIAATLTPQAIGTAAAKPKAKAHPAPRAPTLFSCRLRGGKVVTVTGTEGGLVYRYGAPGRPELTIVGKPADKNIFYAIAVHGGDWDKLLRFVKGEYSYIVNSFPRNEIVDNVPISSLIVFRGSKKILERDCSSWADLDWTSIDLEDYPENPKGAPSIFEE